MATLLTCDHCGGLIDTKEPFARLAARTVGNPASRLGWSRDYHAMPGQDCLGKVLSIVEHSDTMALGVAVHDG